jgi:SAM-dependent methyltransferase
MADDGEERRPRIRRSDIATGSTDRWASGTDYESYVGRWSRLVAPEFLDWLGIAPGRRWLDVGCGTGALTDAILKRCEPRSVVGVDPSETFVAHAQATVVDDRATFSAGTAARTGLDDGAADVVVSGLVLNFVPDVDEALAEARRVVTPGGVVAVYVWDYADGMQFIRRFWDAAVALDPAARPLDEGVRFLIAAPKPLARAFAVAGLEAVDVRPIEVPTIFPDFDDLWTPFLGGTGPAPVYVASLAEGARDAIRDRLRSSIAEEPDGSVRLEARAWAARGRRPRVLQRR